MTPETATADMQRAYAQQCVEPLLGARFPDLAYAIGRLGPGSDVLGLDDLTSRDHDWGLRLTLLVPPDAVTAVRAELDRSVPESYRGLPTRFPVTGDMLPSLRIDVDTTPGFLRERLGFDPCRGMTTPDWLSLSGQAVLEVVAGPLFSDRAGDITTARRALSWYPDDIWRYVLACDWTRLAQEMPSAGRAADVGDDIGSRVITARLVQVVMHLAFLLERRWPPYAKWFGRAFRDLHCAADLAPLLDGALRGTGRAERQEHLADALAVVLRRQNDLGLSDAPRATVAFWDRPHLDPEPAIVAQLLAAIEDPEVRALPAGRGSLEQLTANVDVLMDPQARRAVVGC